MSKVLTRVVILAVIILHSGCAWPIAVGAGAGGTSIITSDLKVRSTKSVDQVVAAIEKTCADLEFEIEKKEVRPLWGRIIANGDFGRIRFEVKTKAVEHTDISIKANTFGTYENKSAQDFIYDKLKPEL
tara:strand:+ start:602 stop:988 length:387 start_codon:yes stop_codon:yes gene_type:complete